jgi:hypothetical protein
LIPSSLHHPDDFAAAIRATRAEMTVIGRGHYTAKLTRIDLHRLWMQRFYDNLPRIAHSAAATGRAIVTFRTQLGPSLLWSGVELQPTTITRHNEGAFQSSSGPLAGAPCHCRSRTWFPSVRRLRDAI